MFPVVVVEAAAILVLAVLVAGLLRSHAEILRSLHDLGAGIETDDVPALHPARLTTLSGNDVAHDISGSRLDGTASALAVVGAGQDTLLLFLSSGCLSCQPFWSDLSDPQALPDGTRTVVVVQDEDNRRAIEELAARSVAEVVLSSAAWVDYGVPGSPHAALVHGPTGRVVGEGTGQDLRQVVDLLRHAGQSAPDPRDNAERIDRELAVSGIGTGHHSLYPPESDT